MIRPQTILIVILVLGVAFFGAGLLTSGSEPSITPTPDIALESVTSAEVDSTETPTSESAPVLTSTPRPRPTAKTEPSSTSEPRATERPVAPDTGLEGETLIVERGDSGRKEVALTFDAGEGAGHTAKILDMLEEAGIKGTFGVTGMWVEENPDLARRIVDEGHQLINHTYDHASWTGVSTGLEPITDDQRQFEIDETEQIIVDTTGYDAKPYFRFPYGDYDAESLTLLGEAGYSYTMFWSCDTQGWNGYTPDQIVEICGPEAARGGPGAILLMHVADDNDFAALPVLIKQYRDGGYDFVTCERLIQP